MALATKDHARSVSIEGSSDEEALDSSKHSFESSDSDSGSGSDSDSLDSHASRKRRKIAAVVEDDALKVVAAPAPSRIKAKSVNQDAADEKPTSNAGISVPLDLQTSFASLDVKPWLVGALEAMAIKRPTGIQKGCIPEILKGRDCIGGSRTGSGKTVAFAVPILQKWAEDPFGIFAVILTPTRELALQIYEQVRAISSPQQLKAVLITGGSDMRPQATALAQRPHILIATPGRLADHIRTSGEDTTCGLRRVRMVVLDEADRLLASGSTGSMLPDVEECLSILPPPSKRQTLLFTATITPEVRALKELPRTPGKPPVFVCEVDTQILAIPAQLRQTHLQGDAVTFVGQRDVQLVQAIEGRVGRQMAKWEEDGVNLETRVVREALKLVGEKKREAMLEIEEGREVGGKRKRGKKKLVK
ncbi:hypothetical protein QTJ16_001550 [Diplocarpon rosae]|uniref:ATP-dependent RNA helicase DBP8 n=1 Tax=Diplocarpon rosae TaxID=946125 RepID=A0AAD9T4C0_9HELO|nr:hypothetical protein QTJ16_001550 [Diplocarpon rosae]